MADEVAGVVLRTEPGFLPSVVPSDAVGVSVRPSQVCMYMHGFGHGATKLALHSDDGEPGLHRSSQCTWHPHDAMHEAI